MLSSPAAEKVEVAVPGNVKWRGFDGSPAVEVLCGAGRVEPFDELSTWICIPTLTRHSHLMRAARGNFHLLGHLRTARCQSKGGETRKRC